MSILTKKVAYDRCLTRNHCCFTDNDLDAEQHAVFGDTIQVLSVKEKISDMEEKPCLTGIPIGRDT